MQLQDAFASVDVHYWFYYVIFTPSQQDAMVPLLSSINANRQACSLFLLLFENKSEWFVAGLRHSAWMIFPVSRRDMRPRCRLICVHFSSGKGKGAVILWETPVCLLRSPTINPAKLKAGHHTDSIRWGGWQSAPWLPGYWLCFYLCALNWSEWGRERVSRHNSHRSTTRWAARVAVDESNSV